MRKSYSEEDHLFTAKLNRHLDVCVGQIRDINNAVEVLRILDDLQVVSFEDLKVLFPKSDLIAILSKCLELGLLEVQNESMYRIPRLVQRRLEARLRFDEKKSSETIGRNERLRRLLDAPLGRKPDEPIFERIETRIRSELLSAGESKGKYSKFVTAAYLLHAGIRAYERQDYAAALKLLRVCVRQRAQLPEVNTRCVMLRYFGLAAAREEKNADLQQAVELLRMEGGGANKFNSRVKPVADAEFLLGFDNRLKERWRDAMHHYKKSLMEIQDDGRHRLGDCHREMAECCLHLGEEYYADARYHAREAYKSHDNIMSLDILVKVLMESVWNDEILSEKEKKKLEDDLDLFLNKLERLSTALQMGMWHQRKAEDFLQYGDSVNLRNALEYARTAFEISRREDYYPLLWKCLLQTNTDESNAELHGSLKQAMHNSRYKPKTKSVAARYLCAVLVAQGEIPAARDILHRYKVGFPEAIRRQLETAISSRNIGSINFV